MQTQVVASGLLKLADLIESGAPGARLLAAARAAFSELNAAEAQHVSLALERDGFDFEGAQSRLRSAFADFSELARRIARVSDAGSALELALVAESAPLTSPRDLDVIRESRRLRSC